MIKKNLTSFSWYQSELRKKLVEIRNIIKITESDLDRILEGPKYVDFDNIKLDLCDTIKEIQYDSIFKSKRENKEKYKILNEKFKILNEEFKICDEKVNTLYDKLFDILIKYFKDGKIILNKENNVNELEEYFDEVIKENKELSNILLCIESFEEEAEFWHTYYDLRERQMDIDIFMCYIKKALYGILKDYKFKILNEEFKICDEKVKILNEKLSNILNEENNGNELKEYFNEVIKGHEELTNILIECLKLHEDNQESE